MLIRNQEVIWIFTNHRFEKTSNIAMTKIKPRARVFSAKKVLPLFLLF